MANKLAGQKAKFTKAFVTYNTTEDEEKKANSVRLMAQVLCDAPQNGFSELQVTGNTPIPADVFSIIHGDRDRRDSTSDDSEQIVGQVDALVDKSDVLKRGDGSQSVYAYGYACAPDRLKVGRTEGDVKDRVAKQIGTSSPDRPALRLILRTDNCRALEMTIHGVLRLWQRKVAGGGDEWFIVTRDELLQIYERLHVL